MCVAMTSPAVTAQQVLDSVSSQVPYRYVDEGAYGRAVCQVQDEPPGSSFDKSNCLSGGTTWSLFCSSPWQNDADGSTNGCFTADGSWQYSSHGISSLQLRDGDAFGLKYESGPSRPAAAAGICPAVSGDRHAPTPAPRAASPAPAPRVAGASPAQPPQKAAAAGAPVASTTPSDGPTAASPSPGDGGLQTPAGPAAGAAPRGAPAQPPGGQQLGALAAAAAATVLIGAAVAQVVLPRWRQ